MMAKPCLVLPFLSVFCGFILVTSTLEEFKGIKLIPKKSVENNPDQNTTDKGEDLCEGDMVCDKRKSEGGANRNAINGEQRRWIKLNGIVTVPFVFEPEIIESAKKVVFESAKDYADWTCINFVERTDQVDYIRIYKGNSCSSRVGRQGGEQWLSLGFGCDSRGVATHEMMHALGFYHEQSRNDRDEYVTVRFEHIKPSHAFNFNKCSDCTDIVGAPYDYRSIMHYGPYDFTVDDEYTIVPKEGDPKILGQRAGLCSGDIKKLNLMYNCGGVTASPNKTLNGMLPCDRPMDMYTTCDEMIHYCSSPWEDYKVPRIWCPISCWGWKKTDPYDEYRSCRVDAIDPDHDYCNTDPKFRKDCAYSCAGKNECPEPN